METAQSKNTVLNISVQDLSTQYISTLKAITAHAARFSYAQKGDTTELSNCIVNVFQLMSRNARKRTGKRFNRFAKRPTKSNANKLFAFLHKAAAENIVNYKGTKVSLEVGARETSIQVARTKWVEARDSAAHLLAQYKKEKGDFYKKQLSA